MEGIPKGVVKLDITGVALVSKWDRKTHKDIDLYLILLAKSPLVENERLRWNLGAFGSKDNLLHLTVGFAFDMRAFCRYVKSYVKPDPVAKL